MKENEITKWYPVSYAITYQVDRQVIVQHFVMVGCGYLPTQNRDVSKTPQIKAFAFMAKIIEDHAVENIQFKAVYQSEIPLRK
jgi:hypothetical protein